MPVPGRLADPPSTQLDDLAVQPVFRSEVDVELVKASADDSDVVWAARVSTAGEKSLLARDEDPQKSAGLIRFLMKNRHGSPFEHNSMTFLVSAPIFVFREFHRHRVGWSYNESSGRYRETGAARSSLPSSTSIMAATLVTGLVIDAIQKIASGFSGILPARS